MPYVPSRKTKPPAEDREVIDAAVEKIALTASERITNNLSLIEIYRSVFIETARALYHLLRGEPSPMGPEKDLAQAICDVSAKYGYEGAYLGEVNYAFTRFIQRVPQIKVKSGAWAQELRYWLYAATVEALTSAASETHLWSIGVSGVFEDIKDEYKRRVNTAYEAEQIMKSGDCYDGPYYTRLVEVVDHMGKHIGYQEVMLKRSDDTLHLDRLPGHFVLSQYTGGKKW